MTDSEVNIIIAEFMGLYPLSCGKFYTKEPPSEKGRHLFNLMYTESLDALVSVWEKIDSFPWLTKYDGDYFAEFQVKTGPYKHIMIKNMYKDKCKTIQQAAAYATAKVILELRNE